MLRCSHGHLQDCCASLPRMGGWIVQGSTLLSLVRNATANHSGNKAVMEATGSILASVASGALGVRTCVREDLQLLQDGFTRRNHMKDACRKNAKVPGGDGMVLRFRRTETSV